MTLTLGDFSRVLDLNNKYDPAPASPSPLFTREHDLFRPVTPVAKAHNTSTFTNSEVPLGLGSFGNVWSFLGTTPPLPTPASTKTTASIVSAPSSPLHSKSALYAAKSAGKEAPIKQKPKKTAPAKQALGDAKQKPTDTPQKNQSKSLQVKPAVQQEKIIGSSKASTSKKKASASPAQTASLPVLTNAIVAKPTIPAKESSPAVVISTPIKVKDDVIPYVSLSAPKPNIGFFPSSVQPLASGGKAIASEIRPALKPNHSHHYHRATPRSIEPQTSRSGTDKDWDLFLRILRNFPEDRPSLVAPMNLTTHNDNPTGIHIFVDASNIFIGFMQAMRHARGIPDHVRIPRADLSFDSLALLMERRRPVAKRVLVGSTPHIPAFDKARSVGYQCSILEKVEKARQLTERQIYFKEQEDYRRQQQQQSPYGKQLTPKPPRYREKSGHGGGGNTSGSDTAVAPAQFAPLKKVEQGVDEILHLKICETILDHPDVPGTIVLATGDAAEAEYSDGFLRTIERALERGWKVELLSWKKSISALYLRRNWRGRWGERFRIIELDEYAEDLLELVKEGGASEDAVKEDKGVESC